ncbi:hypothetical protein BSU04_33150 [Caballeronia sordidicola]|uniref:Uncharacterized protein n=1 Tax=Caballeronia sordidicola TaxID=196367 RepID=A0A226WSL7_CABSO|nr:hypothetical protein BSU04_33150 [Caballeronia sordidicola]
MEILTMIRFEPSQQPCSDRRAKVAKVAKVAKASEAAV